MASWLVSELVVVDLSLLMRSAIDVINAGRDWQASDAGFKSDLVAFVEASLMELCFLILLIRLPIVY